MKFEAVNPPGVEGEWYSAEIRHATGKAKRANAHLLKKLEKHGVDAQGVITQVTGYWSTNFGQVVHWEDHTIRVRAHLPDGSTPEFETVVEVPDERVKPTAGTIVGVRFDPEDSSRMAVQSEALWQDMWAKLDAIKAAEGAQQATADATQDAQDQAAIAAAEAKLASGETGAS